MLAVKMMRCLIWGPDECYIDEEVLASILTYLESTGRILFCGTVSMRSNQQSIIFSPFTEKDLCTLDLMLNAVNSKKDLG